MWKALALQLSVIGSAMAPSPAAARAASCAGAETNFRAARAELRRAIETYAACVAGSTGSSDCAADFRQVRAAQAEFKTAVADLHGSCPPE